MTAVLERQDWHDWPLEAKLKLRRAAWKRAARPAQQLPEGDWRVWYLQGGRGSGKTRGAAEAFAELIEEHDEPGAEWAVIAPTYGDGRDVCIEGPSGLLQALGLPRWFDGWNRSMGELRLPSGGIVYVDGADDGALRVQGKNLYGAWCDEIGLWRRWDIAWRESVAFAVRLAPAKIIASGTPKEGHGLVRLLIEDPEVIKSRMRTADNLANLSAAAIAELEARYAGTRRGRQELEGEFLTDVPGALWTRTVIDENRVDTAPDFDRVVVAVDPAVTSGEGADETGIVVVGTSGRDEHQHWYVIEDATLHGTPDEWANEAVACYDEHHADKVVAEVNNGGDLVGRLIRSVWSKVNYGDVRATRGKRVRAEPIAGLYEQGRVHHVGDPGQFSALEEQLVTWTQDSPGSPDRLDALVWAITELEMNAPRRMKFRGAA